MWVITLSPQSVPRSPAFFLPRLRGIAQREGAIVGSSHQDAVPGLGRFGVKRVVYVTKKNRLKIGENAGI